MSVQKYECFMVLLRLMLVHDWWCYSARTVRANVWHYFGNHTTEVICNTKKLSKSSKRLYVSPLHSILWTKDVLGQRHQNSKSSEIVCIKIHYFNSYQKSNMVIHLEFLNIGVLWAILKMTWWHTNLLWPLCTLWLTRPLKPLKTLRRRS